MPGRTFNSTSYRYGFDGMEKDDEIKGGGNSYTTLHRQYDSRLGRWFSTDPEEDEAHFLIKNFTKSSKFRTESSICFNSIISGQRNHPMNRI